MTSLSKTLSVAVAAIAFAAPAAFAQQTGHDMKPIRNGRAGEPE